MVARDIYHDCVRNALVKDGWTITDDPLRLKWDGKNTLIDLGAERVLAAEKGTRKIAVEVKSFASPSVMDDVHRAVGQYIVYQSALLETEPERELFLAVPQTTLEEVFRQPNASAMVKRHEIRVIGYDAEKEEIASWTS
jgi:hypothetical protein